MARSDQRGDEDDWAHPLMDTDVIPFERTVEQLPTDSKTMAIMVGLAIALSATTMILAIIWIKQSNSDFDFYFLPWYQTIVADGRLTSLRSDFSDYTPPYVYLLILCTLTDGFVDRVVAVKICSMLWTLFGARQIYGICLIAGRTKHFSIVAAVVFYTLPEIILNNIVWGQSDIIYTSFLLAFVRYILLRRRLLAMVMFGMALSFKPQAILISPFVGSLFVRDLFRADRLYYAMRDASASLLAYAAMMLPAILAGRPWWSLFNVYTSQPTSLSVSAPNFYTVIQQFLPRPEQIQKGPLLSQIAPTLFLEMGRFFPDRDIVLGLGFAFALLICCLLLVCFSTQRWRPRLDQLLTMLALTALLVPFVTPMMHERYFFAAGTMTYLLALIRPATWPVALCMQIAAVFCYQDFFLHYYYGGFFFVLSKGLTIASVAFETASVVLLIRCHLRDRQVNAQMPSYYSPRRPLTGGIARKPTASSE